MSNCLVSAGDFFSCFRRDFATTIGNSQASEYVNDISADDAFARAIGAMYWTGYWTAVFEVSSALYI
jgi:hypothetical protein